MTESLAFNVLALVGVWTVGFMAWHEVARLVLGWQVRRRLHRLCSQRPMDTLQ